MRARLSKTALLLSLIGVSLTSVVPAFAQEDRKTRDQTALAAGETETIEASIAGYSWFWRDQVQQKITGPDGTDIAAAELKNPYCPDTSPVGSPPEQACKPGRLPVEVRGDYKQPHKISAVNFDLAIVPPGSTIKKFEVRMWEAPDEFSRSTQYNHQDKRVQACEIDGVFGDGEARLYKEKPAYECTKSDATAKRGSTTVGKGADEKELFYWDFNLTKQAQEWMKNEVFFTSVMLTPVKPKKAGPNDDAWQVVFTGPLEAKRAIDTKVVYEAPPLPDLPELPPPGDVTPTDSDPLTNDPGFTSGSGSVGVGTGTTTTTGTGTAPTTPEGQAAEQPAAESEETTPDPALAKGSELASDEKTVPSGLPLYVWLAILAGMLGFSMVRSVVLEKNTGIRPDGVLAQIQRLNAQRRGAAVAGTATGGASAFGAISAGLGAIGSKITSGAGKLAQLVSRKKG